MVRKLFKHEIISYLRTLLPVNIILFAVAIMTRVILFFENDSIPYNIIFGSSVFAFVVGIIACIFMTFIVSVVRFYKNLFTAEGYLSFTLPVTGAQHIWVKLGAALLFQIFAAVTIILSLVVVASGEPLAEIFKAMGYLLEFIWKDYGGHIVFFIIELLVLLLVSLAYEYLLWYACISLGQRSRKNRVFMAIVWYFVYYMITQAVSTVFVIIMAVLDATGKIGPIMNWIFEHLLASLHIGFIGGSVIMAAVAAVFFLVSKNTMKNKLNLE